MAKISLFGIPSLLGGAVFALSYGTLSKLPTPRDFQRRRSPVRSNASWTWRYGWLLSVAKSTPAIAACAKWRHQFIEVGLSGHDTDISSEHCFSAIDSPSAGVLVM